MRKFTKFVVLLFVLSLPSALMSQTPTLHKILYNELDYSGDSGPDQSFDTTTFTYDSNGNVTMVENSDTRIYYQYDLPNGQITVKQYSKDDDETTLVGNNVLTIKDGLVIQQDANATDVEGNTLHAVLHYYYENGYLTKGIVSYAGIDTTMFVLTWNDGNIVEAYDEDTHYWYTYSNTARKGNMAEAYCDAPFSTCVSLDLAPHLVAKGYFGHGTKNLIEKIDSRELDKYNFSGNFTYTFDTNGLMTSVSEVDYDTDQNKKEGEYYYTFQWDNSSTGIGAMKHSTNQSMSVYSTNGIRRNHLNHGINIVRFADGVVKKIMKK